MPPKKQESFAPGKLSYLPIGFERGDMVEGSEGIRRPIWRHLLPMSVDDLDA